MWTSSGRPSLRTASRTSRASGRLSSANRRISGRAPESLDLLRDGEEEGGSLFRFGFDPDSSAITLDHPLANCQANAGAGILLVAMEPFENAKDFLLVLRVDADPVILNRKTPFGAVRHRANVD